MALDSHFPFGRNYLPKKQVNYIIFCFCRCMRSFALPCLKWTENIKHKAIGASKTARFFVVSKYIFHQPFGVAPGGFFFLSVDQARRKRISISRRPSCVLKGLSLQNPHRILSLVVSIWSNGRGSVPAARMCELRATGTLPLPYGGWRMPLLVATATSLAGAALFAFLWCTRADAYEGGAFHPLPHARTRTRY